MPLLIPNKQLASGPDLRYRADMESIQRYINSLRVGGKGRGASFVIAPSDARPLSKAGADLVLPGVNDEVAIAGLVGSATGSDIGILILDGNVKCGGPISLGGGWSLYGLGNWTTQINATSGFAIDAGSSMGDLTIANLGTRAPQGIRVGGDSTVYSVTIDTVGVGGGLGLDLGGDSAVDMVTVFASNTGSVALQTHGDCTVSNSSFFGNGSVPTIKMGGDDQVTGCAIFGGGGSGVTGPVFDGVTASIANSCLVVGNSIYLAGLSQDLMSDAVEKTLFVANQIFTHNNVNTRGVSNLILGNAFYSAFGGTLTDLGVGNVFSYSGGGVGDNFLGVV